MPEYDLKTNLICLKIEWNMRLTVEPAPACDVTGLVVVHGGALLGQAGWLDHVIEDGLFLQF